MDYQLHYSDKNSPRVFALGLLHFPRFTHTMVRFILIYDDSFRVIKAVETSVTMRLCDVFRFTMIQWVCYYAYILLKGLIVVKWLARLYRKLTFRFRNKLIFTYVCIIVAPLLVSTFFTYSRFSSEIDKTYIQNNQLLMQQLNERLDDYFREIDQYALSFYTQDLLSTHENDLSRSSKDNERLNLISLLYSQKKEIDSILFYRPQSRESYYVDRTHVKIIYDSSALEHLDWYRVLMGDARDQYLEPTHLNDQYPISFEINNDHQVFTIYRSYRRNLVARVYGIASINIRLDEIKRICSGTIGSKEETVVFLNRDGQIFLSSSIDPKMTENANVFEKIQKTGKRSGHLVYTGDHQDKWMMIYNKSAFNGNIVYKLIPLKVLNQQASYVKNLNIIIMCGIIATLIVATALLTYTITRPLYALERAMRRAGEGDFQSFSREFSSDEIGRMSRIYNKMLNQINLLINDKYVMELNYRNAQLKTLQAQINPHFLYNTLQSIGSVAIQEGLKDLYKMTHALSGYLRYSIKPGGDLVPLEEEMRNAERYLLIQKFRYEDNLDYEIDWNEQANGILIPKLTLQPVVENAVIHGLEPKKGRGSIRIRCELDQDFLYVIVWDDGVGMEQDQLDGIRRDLEQTTGLAELDHIGLVNVLGRLKISVGERSLIDLQSSLGHGTAVQIRIPLPSDIRQTMVVGE